MMKTKFLLKKKKKYIGFFYQKNLNKYPFIYFYHVQDIHVLNSFRLGLKNYKTETLSFLVKMSALNFVLASFLNCFLKQGGRSLIVCSNSILNHSFFLQIPNAVFLFLLTKNIFVSSKVLSIFLDSSLLWVVKNCFLYFFAIFFSFLKIYMFYLNFFFKLYYNANNKSTC